MTPVLMGMFKRTIDRQVDGHELAGNLKDEETVKDLLQTVQNTMLPEEAIELSELTGLSGQAMKDLIFDKVKSRYASQMEKLSDPERQLELRTTGQNILMLLTKCVSQSDFVVMPKIIRLLSIKKNHIKCTII